MMNARSLPSFEFPRQTSETSDALAEKDCAEGRNATRLSIAIKGCVAGIVVAAILGMIGYLAWDYASKSAQAEAEASATQTVSQSPVGIEALYRIGR